MSESNDAVLQRHRARFEAHRQWLREQQAALSSEGGGVGLGGLPQQQQQQSSGSARPSATSSVRAGYAHQTSRGALHSTPSTPAGGSPRNHHHHGASAADGYGGDDAIAAAADPNTTRPYRSGRLSSGGNSAAAGHSARGGNGLYEAAANNNDNGHDDAYEEEQQNHHQQQQQQHQQAAPAMGPAYSAAQRNQKVAAAAEWIEDVAHQRLRSTDPLAREYSPNYVGNGNDNNGGHGGSQPHNSRPQTARSFSRAGSHNPSIRAGAASSSAAAHHHHHNEFPQFDANTADEEGAGDFHRQNHQHYGAAAGEGGDAHADEGGEYGYGNGDDDYYGDGYGDEGAEEEEDRAALMLMEGSPLHVYSRSTQWARRKEQKVLEMRAAAEAESLRQCTFRPDRQRARASSVGPSSFSSRALALIDNHHYDPHHYSHHNRSNAAADPSNVSTVAEVSGWEEFICRRLRAKQIANEKTARLRSDGSRWTGAPTVVEEFKLGTGNTSKRLKSVLKPPVAAPNTGAKAAIGATLLLPQTDRSVAAAAAARRRREEQHSLEQQQRQRGFVAAGSTAGSFSNTYGRAPAAPAGTAAPSAAAPAASIYGALHTAARRRAAADISHHHPNESAEAAEEEADPNAIRASDVPIGGERLALPPRGLFSLRGSSTFVEGMVGNFDDAEEAV